MKHISEISQRRMAKAQGAENPVGLLFCLIMAVPKAGLKGNAPFREQFDRKCFSSPELAG